MSCPQCVRDLPRICWQSRREVCNACFRSSSPSKAVLREDMDNIPTDDDEHRLIARYTARLAADANQAVSYNTLMTVMATTVFITLCSLLYQHQ